MKPAAFKIIANDVDITSLLQDRLERLTVSDAPGIDSDTVTIEIDNRNRAVTLPPTGAKLEVFIGSGPDLVFKGIYQVTELEEPLDVDAITIHATAAEFKTSGIKATKDRTFDDITFGGLVSKIAAEHGLEPVIAPRLASVKFDHIDQKAESDLNLLTRLGRQYDAIAKPVADRLLVTEKGAGKTASGRDMDEITISDAANSAGRVTITERTNYSAVIAHWFDDSTQKKIAVTAGSGEPSFTLRKPYASEQEAEAAARAELDKKQRGKKTLSLERPLTPDMTAESRVRVTNHKESANGLWIAESVEHIIEPGRLSVSSAKLNTPNE